MAIRYELLARLLGYWICVVFEIFIKYFVVSYNKQQTGYNQAEYLYTAVCDVHNDNNHSAAVCVKDT